MVNVITIPYKDLKSKIRIMKENKGMRFTDCGSYLYCESYFEDEEPVWKMIRLNRFNARTI